MVIAGGEGSNLGLAVAGQHSVIRRVGQCYRDTQWPSLLTMSLHNHTAAAAHWNQALSVCLRYIYQPPTAQQIPACLEGSLMPWK